MEVVVHDEEFLRLSANVLSGRDAIKVDLMEDGLCTESDVDGK